MEIIDIIMLITAGIFIFESISKVIYKYGYRKGYKIGIKDCKEMVEIENRIKKAKENSDGTS